MLKAVVVLLGNAVDVTPSASVDTVRRLSIVSRCTYVNVRNISMQMEVC